MLVLQAATNPILVQKQPVSRRQSYSVPGGSGGWGPAPLATPSSIPALPSYGGGGTGAAAGCSVERSTEPGPDCQQGGQECREDCRQVEVEDCSGGGGQVEIHTTCEQSLLSV